PEHDLDFVTGLVYMFANASAEKVLVFGHEGAQTEERMPYFSCIWPHVLVASFSQVNFARLTLPEAARRVPLVEGFQQRIERLVHETRSESRMLSDLDSASIKPHWI
ncbi:MAG: hypothetical protein ACKPKO_33685, partial [Candidatus Fonsibacter sp.]